MFATPKDGLPPLYPQIRWALSDSGTQTSRSLPVNTVPTTQVNSEFSAKLTAKPPGRQPLLTSLPRVFIWKKKAGSRNYQYNSDNKNVVSIYSWYNISYKSSPTRYREKYKNLIHSGFLGTFPNFNSLYWYLRLWVKAQPLRVRDLALDFSRASWVFSGLRVKQVSRNVLKPEAWSTTSLRPSWLLSSAASVINP